MAAEEPRASGSILDHPELVFQKRVFSFAKERGGAISVGLQCAIAYAGSQFPRSLQGVFLWPAAEALSEFSAANSSRFSGKKVLELGAGAGLLGLTIAKCDPPPLKVVITDGSALAVELLRENLRMSLESSDVDAATPEIDARILLWGVPLPNESDGGEFDVVIGADLVFDDDCDVFGLLRTAKEALAAGGEFILGMMDRSERVRSRFEREAAEFGCEWKKDVFKSESWRDSVILVYTLKF
ncbi:hypothetical protein BSKO_10915 [Bryopsis sp. KO-2023]|nr:hypothetical protein BSKO_10915 [Bryopsis sp. KO-2023]